MILLIDNYDSFVHNLARYLQLLGQETAVVRNDRISVAEVRGMRPQAVVVSPGPGAPDNAGNALEIVRAIADDIPLLGVCLGHQTIAAAFGARIVKAKPMHGRTSLIRHDGRGVFTDLPNPLTVCRYHSLVVERSWEGAGFEISAESDDGHVMAIRRRNSLTVGVQFHPEAVLIAAGYPLLTNFLTMAGCAPRSQAPPTELVRKQPPASPWPDSPATF